jgi:hypothetical protein
MSILTVTVCEECGKQSTSCDGWLIVDSLDVRGAKSGVPFVSERGIDLCSQGCALRYVSRALERAISTQDMSVSKADKRGISAA